MQAKTKNAAKCPINLLCGEICPYSDDGSLRKSVSLFTNQKSLHSLITKFGIRARHSKIQKIEDSRTNVFQVHLDKFGSFTCPHIGHICNYLKTFKSSEIQGSISNFKNYKQFLYTILFR